MKETLDLISVVSYELTVIWAQKETRNCQLTVLGDLWRNQLTELWQWRRKDVVNRCLKFGVEAVSTGRLPHSGVLCVTGSTVQLTPPPPPPSDDLGLEPHTANRVIPSSDQWRCAINITDDRMGLAVSGPTLEWPIDSESWERKRGGVEVCLYVAVGEVGWRGVEGWGSRYVPPPDVEMPGTARNIKSGADRLSCQRSELHRWCGSHLQCAHSSEGGLKTQSAFVDKTDNTLSPDSTEEWTPTRPMSPPSSVAHLSG